jgi:hypothetical protein
MPIGRFSTFALKTVLGLLSFSVLAPAIPIPSGTIAGIALTGTGTGQFAQSMPQAGEIQFNFTLNNNEFITGEVCVFVAGCVANGTTGSFNAAAPSLFVSFSVGCPSANCGPVSYDLSADWVLNNVPNGYTLNESTVGSFASNDVEGMAPGDAMTFQSGITGVSLAQETVNPTAGVGSYPFSFSNQGSTFNSGASTASLVGSLTVDGPEDTLNYTGQLTVTPNAAPEPGSFGFAVVGIGLAALALRRLGRRC